MNKRNLVIIFIRNPVLGKVKTRLSKSVGNSTALKIYQILLKKTKQATQELPCDRAVFYSDKIVQNDLWSTPLYQKEIQIGSDLGARMKHAFQISFEKKYEKVVLIGSDVYNLDPSLIEKAFEELTQNEVVIGPAADGGYYLIGLKKVHPRIFKNKSWGTPSVRRDTLKDLEKVDVYLLPSMNDIDVIEDIQEHPELSRLLSSP